MFTRFMQFYLFFILLLFVVYFSYLVQYIFCHFQACYISK